MDVKLTFLNGELEEEVYVKQPQGYMIKREEKKVNKKKKKKKALYGLKQAPRARCTSIDTYLVKNGFQRYPYEQTLYVKFDLQGNILTMCLYVDDLIIISKNLKMIIKFKEVMISQFAMTNMRLMSYFLEIEVIQIDKGIFIFQKTYASDILKNFKMELCNLFITLVKERLKLGKDNSNELVDPTNFR